MLVVLPPSVVAPVQPHSTATLQVLVAQSLYLVALVGLDLTSLPLQQRVARRHSAVVMVAPSLVAALTLAVDLVVLEALLL